MGNMKIENPTTFASHEFKVRTMIIDGEPYFVGKDVATALGYAKPQNAITAHIDSDDSLKQGIKDSVGRIQETTLINESGLYSLILSSKLPAAKEFKRWITKEVLPTIRQTGGYVNNEETFVNTYFSECSQQVKDFIIVELKGKMKLIEDKKALSDENKALKPYANIGKQIEESKGNLLIREFAKVIYDSKGIKIGEKKLHHLLRIWGLLLTNKSEPTQYAVENGWMSFKEIVETDGKKKVIRTSPKITPKGQIYLLNRMLDYDKTYPITNLISKKHGKYRKEYKEYEWTSVE